MDPNATLAQLRTALEDEDIAAAFEHFDALDRWLCRGGFAPEDWA